MPKLTITADEKTLRRLRIEAATRNISVSRFAGEVLKETFSADAPQPAPPPRRRQRTLEGDLAPLLPSLWLGQ